MGNKKESTVQKGYHCAWQIHYHIVFPVKYRKVLLDEEVVKVLKNKLKRITVINWADHTKSLNFTAHDWLENFMICVSCGHSNYHFCEFPKADKKNHIHYFIKDIPTKEELERAKKMREEFAKK